jgi:hypothetical protein
MAENSPTVHRSRSSARPSERRVVRVLKRNRTTGCSPGRSLYNARLMRRRPGKPFRVIRAQHGIDSQIAENLNILPSAFPKEWVIGFRGAAATSSRFDHSIGIRGGNVRSVKLRSPIRTYFICPFSGVLPHLLLTFARERFLAAHNLDRALGMQSNRL